MKKILCVLLIPILCLSMTACGEKGKDYKSAVHGLENIIEYTCLGYTKSELNEQHRLEDNIEMYEYMTLPDLYQRFSELGNYKKSKEVLSRFSIVENGFVTLKVNSVDALGQLHTVEQAVLLDTQGRIAIQFSSSGQGTLYVYDEQGNIVREGNNLLHKYNDRGERIETDLFSYKYEGLESITNYSYDAQGNCVEAKKQYAKAPTETITFTYKYDEQGNCIEKVICSDNDSEPCTINYTYIMDEQGNPLFKFSANNMNKYMEYEEPWLTAYSETGKVVFISEPGSGLNFEISDYKYENGMPVSITFADGLELIFEYSQAYFFDVEGFELPEV